MAGGPITPVSQVPQGNGNLFPFIYQGGGGNAAPYDEMMGVVASLGADSTWMLRFPIPESIPSGTAKLRLLALANASTGNAKVTVNDAVVAAGSSPSAASLTAETQATLSWSSGDADKYKEAKVTLTPSMVANSVLVAALTFNTSGWTLAQNSGWYALLIWE
jgi:hypothetical protein